jgi:UDP-N-acetylmuramoyl-L-alanyl-D-glutamate--2,6-diaminopimelate ligase
MKLRALATVVAGSTIAGDADLVITGLAYHTRDVVPGTLFFCIPGLATDGHDFAPEAVAQGAAALVCERPLGLGATEVHVPSARGAMALMAARFLGEPSRELSVAGVTGTNGKTTCAYLLAGIFGAAGLPAALLGTVVNRIGGIDYPVQLTTAESLDLQRMFRSMVDAGDRACAMEVSSHALALGRSEGIDFDAVIFTNLTRDHLDFHEDLEDYYGAKRRLFLSEGGRRPQAAAVVNTGGEWGRRLAAECRQVYGDDLWTCAFAGEADAEALALDVQCGADGSRFTLAVERLGLRERLQVRLAACFNVENALVAATAALAMGLPVDAVRTGLAGISGVPGRFEAVRAGQPFTVVVDYSHTPDSLENALDAARTVAQGRVLVVFGCGGDRDRGKRPLMGEIAVRLSDLAFVTSDNPRGEDPLAIIAEIVAGVPDEFRPRLVVEQDRHAAIALALDAARPGDVVVIAGKGHEQGQIIGDRKVPFDDGAVAREHLAALWGGGE